MAAGIDIFHITYIHRFCLMSFHQPGNLFEIIGHTYRLYEIIPRSKG